MSEFEKAIEQAIADGEIAGCTVQAINRDGSFKFAKAFGTDAANKPFELSTVVWIASCTKLMTSVCALQLVERGQASLDEPVYKHIPELKERKVLTGFNEDGSPIEAPHKNPLTLRHLLTHTSGLSYDVMHPNLTAWLKYHGKGDSLSGSVLERFYTPMIFEPGESWMYGPSIDYVGLLIERITGVSLEEYMRVNLWEPLGIKDATFYLSKRPDLKARQAKISKRNPETQKLSEWDELLPYNKENDVEVDDCMGGQGVFTTSEEYLKVLQAVLTTDENEKILKKDTLEQFFSPQLGEASAATLNAILQDEWANRALGGTSQEIKKDWGLGGLSLNGDGPDGKKERTMIWAGLPNLMWWCDRKTGITGLYASQLLPTGDAKSGELARKFEAGIYEQLKNGGGSL